MTLQIPTTLTAAMSLRLEVAVTDLETLYKEEGYTWLTASEAAHIMVARRERVRDPGRGQDKILHTFPIRSLAMTISTPSQNGHKDLNP